LQARITNPRRAIAKTYWVQVEGEPSDEAIDVLARGVVLRDGPTRRAEVRRLDPPPALWPRDPPIRVRRAIPTAWLALTIHEGRNRQVRRMTAAVGLPTLRLVRWSAGDWTLGAAPGVARAVARSVLSSGAFRSRPPRAALPAPRRIDDRRLFARFGPALAGRPVIVRAMPIRCVALGPTPPHRHAPPQDAGFKAFVVGGAAAPDARPDAEGFRYATTRRRGVKPLFRRAFIIGAASGSCTCTSATR
jgi:23S rRNA pseudouridine2457 synthase